ncbi:DUF5991 domain-containing protein [Methylobacterium gnaphalii]|uniref:Lipoprotein n=1 Tax=Methylobacterium gnaphalii TaxID=1010610 RepID=A0A512JM72_9HYPH|nr:DUF5991 domain-containing protein [Methylobacterium gnaphalii]GEP10953.1 hypothetical protein MGN01_27980 [Methylobacterium gnaphalii]GJD69809.1 hypothetical protein MMMDOFMJ_2747 [Methylobacterium gnaphalii]GLS48063.1 hypothetical protein GCM10007885_09070 [Methylobacterium gnaphalii]
MRHCAAAIIAIAALEGGYANAQTGTAAGWKGAYRYAFDGGSTAGGTPISITYDLVLVPGAARGGCRIVATGFQTDERIVCHTTGDDKKLTVTFHGYDDGRTVNRNGVAVYKPGQALFVLKRGEDDTLVTYWDGLRPDLPADAANPGEYFKPAKR